MKQDMTTALVHEHNLIKRMLTLLERNAPRTAEGSYSDYRFYLDGVDFIRNYADRFHHAKEEDVLFAALVANGMPREHSPVAAMLMEHEQGRAFVRAMEEAASAALAGKSGQDRLIAANALAYAALLREHIAKEDEILYPLSERIIPTEARDAILAGYTRAEQIAQPGLEEHYEALVAHYEAEAVPHAA
jgi:hemerythrin-like domain-containing protein